MSNSPIRFALLVTGLIGLLNASALLPVPAAVTISTGTPASTNAAPVKHGITITTTDEENDDASSKPGAKFELKASHDDGSGWDLEGLLIPLAGIAAVFGTPVLVVFFVCYFKYRRRQESLALVREYLNKGLPVPPELLEEASGPGARNGTRMLSDWQRGFRYTFVGLGIMLALYVAWPHDRTWGWGLIPFVVGGGYLASAWAQQRLEKKPGAPPPGPTAGS